ncbi:unnamed protein product [Phaedon cochleariae]|uniref:UDP-glucuronosyltransferase n=1 Tax=Phaedon cochleariae TaxID=80249 RepID=A0A9P0GQ62_PHACE|nr:unnamed protein product [Phaedon cochleariae]
MFRQLIVLVSLTLAITVNISECARILGIIPTASFSHQVVFRPVWNELAKRGHDVLVITTDPQNDPSIGIREIDISSTAYKLWHDLEYIQRIERHKANPFMLIRHLKVSSSILCDNELQHPEIQSLLNNQTEHFDLLMTEFFHPIMTAFSVRFNCPFIGIQSMDFQNYYHGDSGNPTHPAAFPEIFSPFYGKLTFSERILSFLLNTLMYLNNLIPGGEDEVIKKHFGDDMPPMRDIMYNFSMMFLNVHPAFYARPMGPAFLSIGGGTHLTPVKSLPQDFKEFIEGAEHGVIYFSLGTNVNSERIDPAKRQIFLDTFRELPQRVLWKFDTTDMPNIPANIKIVDWAPQQDILRHPNVKVFITQGGVQSLEEAIFSHVPVVCIPIVADQEKNAKRAADKGIAIHLNYDELNKITLKAAILEAIDNPKYKESAREQAEISVDQPMTGIEKAIWWTEYVLRHKGAPHFRNPIIDLPYYQYYLLDVFGFLIASLLISLWICRRAIRLVYSYLNRLLNPGVNKNIKIKKT